MTVCGRINWVTKKPTPNANSVLLILRRPCDSVGFGKGNASITADNTGNKNDSGHAIPKASAMAMVKPTA